MPIVRRLFVAHLLLAASLAVSAEGGLVESLCDVDEQVLFSCPVGKKLVSICASPDLDGAKGTMQYRFGLNENRELVYPEVMAHPGKHFKFQRTYSRVESAEILELGFQRGNVGYAVFAEWIKGKRAAGINVTIGSKVTTLKCKSLQGIDRFSEIDGLGLPEM